MRRHSRMLAQRQESRSEGAPKGPLLKAKLKSAQRDEETAP
jgi:hypothetical protein